MITPYKNVWSLGSCRAIRNIKSARGTARPTSVAFSLGATPPAFRTLRLARAGEAAGTGRRARLDQVLPQVYTVLFRSEVVSSLALLWEQGEADRGRE